MGYSIKKLEHKKIIRPGEDYYIVDVNYNGYVKRLYKIKGDEDIVELRSYNPDKEGYPDYTEKWKNILAVFKVTASIQLA